MMPDPEGYAPYLRAAFGGMEEGMPKHFPYSIVDREPRQESQIVDCFFDLLEFFEGQQPTERFWICSTRRFSASGSSWTTKTWCAFGDGFVNAMPIGVWTAITGRISVRPRPTNTLGGMPLTEWLWVLPEGERGASLGGCLTL